MSPAPNTEALLVDKGGTATAAGAPSDAPGLGLVQATHFISSALFCTIHVSHSHDPSGFLNLSPNPVISVETQTVGVDTVLTAEKAEGRVSDDFSPVPGFAVSQATHFTASDLF